MSYSFRIRQGFCMMIFFSLVSSTFLMGQMTATEIIRRSDEKLRGKSSKSEIKMTIVRPSWTREIGIKSWSLGDDYALILITAPARDQGVAFLKRDKELWNWQPTINRTIKMPPSMMMQSWMGSDLKNDDLVKESSIIDDYTHKIIGEEMIEGRLSYKIELTPLPDAPVVWGKIFTWIDKADYIQMRSEMYDEDGFLVNTMIAKNIGNLGGKILPRVLEVIPADEEGQKTVIEYIQLDFDLPLESSFFSLKNLKRVS